MIRTTALKFFFRISSTQVGGWFFTTVWPPLDIHILRVSRGRYSVTGILAPALLLTTTGRRSGKARHVPLLYLPWLDEKGRVARDAWVVVGTRGGRRHHANWYLNLRDNPEVQVNCRGVRVSCQSTILEGAERHSQWRRFTAMNPGFENYAGRISRDIPVVLLTAVSEVAEAGSPGSNAGMARNG